MIRTNRHSYKLSGWVASGGVDVSKAVEDTKVISQV